MFEAGDKVVAYKALIGTVISKSSEDDYWIDFGGNNTDFVDLRQLDLYIPDVEYYPDSFHWSKEGF